LQEVRAYRRPLADLLKRLLQIPGHGLASEEPRNSSVSSAIVASRHRRSNALISMGITDLLGNVASVYGLTTVSSIDIHISMSFNMELSPKTKRPAGEPCCEPVVYPDVEREQAQRMASIAKALGDPVRLQLVDVLKKHAGKVCVCELVPLFDLSQPTVSHHLKVLREAGIVGSERQGLWAYYYVIPDALEELSAWLT